MADNIFTQLGKLFQSNVVIRKRDDGKLMVKDLDYSQTALKSNFVLAPDPEVLTLAGNAMDGPVGST